MTDSEITQTIIAKITEAQSAKLYGQIALTFKDGKVVAIKTEKMELYK